MIRKILFLGVLVFLIPPMAWSLEIYRDGDKSLNVGFWGQAWYQYVGDIDRDGDGQWDDTLNDFMVRRTYFNGRRHSHPEFKFFCALCRRPHRPGRAGQSRDGTGHRPCPAGRVGEL